jgi:hypothetical protein
LFGLQRLFLAGGCVFQQGVVEPGKVDIQGGEFIILANQYFDLVGVLGAALELGLAANATLLSRAQALVRAMRVLYCMNASYWRSILKV